MISQFPFASSPVLQCRSRSKAGLQGWLAQTRHKLSGCPALAFSVQARCCSVQSVRVPRADIQQPWQRWANSPRSNRTGLLTSRAQFGGHVRSEQHTARYGHRGFQHVQRPSTVAGLDHIRCWCKWWAARTEPVPQLPPGETCWKAATCGLAVRISEGGNRPRQHGRPRRT